MSVEQLMAQAGWARRLARDLLGDESVAEDLLQEAWISARHPPADVKSEGRWLRRILTNRSHNWRREDARRDSRHRSAGASAEPASNPEELVANLELQRLITGCVLELPEPVRQTVILRYYEGLDSREIARKTATPDGTVRWRLRAGLDELRRRLDESHGGHRRFWVRALAPLAFTRRKGAAPLFLAGVAATLTAAVLSVSVHVLNRAEPSGRSAPRSLPTYRVPAFVTPQPARPSVTFADCSNQLLRLRREIALLEPELANVVDAKILFASGSPNPTAESALRPAIDRALNPFGAPARPYTFECHTWACKLTVLYAEGEPWRLDPSRKHFAPPLREPTPDQDFLERIKGWGVGERPTNDALTGAPLVAQILHIRLASPTGTRVPTNLGTGAVLPPSIPKDPGPVPTTPELCAAELARSEKKLAILQASVEEGISPEARFKKSQPNPTLTSTFGDLVRRILRVGTQSNDVSVECRGTSCAVRTSATYPDKNTWKQQLRNDPEFKKIPVRNEGLMREGREWVWIYFLSDPDAASGGDIVEGVVAEVRSSPALHECEVRHPSTGQLKIIFELPSTGVVDDERPSGEITTRYAGTLGLSPLSRCVEQFVTPLVREVPIPPKVTGMTRYLTLNFPLNSP